MKSEVRAPSISVFKPTQLGRFGAAADGAVAVEFAIVSPFVLATILFLMSIGYMLVMGQSLDFATQKAARQIRTGAVQTAQYTPTTFRTNLLCPLLPSLFNCDDVIVNIQPVPTTDGSYPNEYYSFVNSSSTGLITPPLDNTATSYCPGQAKGYVFVQVLYPVNVFLSFLAQSTVTTTYKGQRRYVVMATATMLNEPFTAPASTC